MKALSVAQQQRERRERSATNGARKRALTPTVLSKAVHLQVRTLCESQATVLTAEGFYTRVNPAMLGHVTFTLGWNMYSLHNSGWWERQQS